jgi:hypothetical protein
MWDDIKSRRQELGDDFDKETSHILDHFKPLEKKSEIGKQFNGLPNELESHISKAIVKLIADKFLELSAQDPPLKVREIGAVLLYLHDVCVSNFSDLAQRTVKIPMKKEL